MPYDANATLRDFLNAAAARQPTPGGGSVTALCGALAAAMGEMVINYSLGKKSLAEFEPQLRPALQKLHNARQLLLDLMIEDQEAFSGLSEAKKLEPGAERDRAMNVALRAAIGAPQAMQATAVAVLEVCHDVVDMVNHFLLSDLAVCADLAMATARCGLYNVRVNLPELADSVERQRVETEVLLVLSRAATLIQQTSPRIWSRYAEQAK